MKDILDRSLCEHISALEKKEYSSCELTSAVIAQIEKKDKKLNAYITKTFDIALQAAKSSDERRSKNSSLSKIDGIPYALKDNISSKSIRTTCASKMLEDHIPPYSAFAYELLEQNGAVLLGKTNMDEFAMGISGETSYFGATLNPIDESCVSGGSSSGSACAVASGMAVFALGSDTGGSVRQPSAFCGLVGIKPTYGTVSRFGLISFAPSFDTIAPIAKTVSDSALLLSLLAKKDARDATCRQHHIPELANDLSGDIKNLKIACLDLALPLANEVRSAMQKAHALLEAMGAELTPIKLKTSSAAYASYYTLSSAEASSNLARFDGVRYGHRAENAKDASELFSRSRSEGFGDEAKRRILFGTMALSSEYSADFYQKATAVRHALCRELNGTFEHYDIILLPTAPVTAYKLGEATGFAQNTQDIYCTLASLSSLPAISLPVKTDSALPVGIQLIGKAHSEALLYKTAFAIEQAMKGGAV